MILYIIYQQLVSQIFHQQRVSLQGVPIGAFHESTNPRPWGRAFERAEEERLKAEAKRQKEAEEVVPSHPSPPIPTYHYFDLYNFLFFRSVMPSIVVVFRFFSRFVWVIVGLFGSIFGMEYKT